MQIYCSLLECFNCERETTELSRSDRFCLLLAQQVDSRCLPPHAPFHSRWPITAPPLLSAIQNEKAVEIYACFLLLSFILHLQHMHRGSCEPSEWIH